MMKKLSILAAIVLSLFFVFPAVSMAEGDGKVDTTVTDFRVSLDKTVTDTDKPVNVVVELLDNLGKVAVFAGSEVESIVLKAGTIIGGFSSVSSLSDEGKFAAAETEKIGLDGGKTGFHIVYDNVGNDTLRFSVVLTDFDGDVLVLPAKEFSITVNQPPNDATHLALKEMAPDDDSADDDNYAKDNYTDDATASDDTEGQIETGNSFVLNIEAVKQDMVGFGYDTTYDEANKTVNQSGKVTITFIGTQEVDSDGNIVKPGKDCVIETVEGQMTNGLALINVPDDTLTKAGEYKIFLSTASGAVKQLNNHYTMWVDAGAPAKVIPSVENGYMNQNDTDGVVLDGNVETTDTLTLTLYDANGNKADKDEIKADVKLGYATTNKVTIPDATDDTTLTIPTGQQSVEGTVTPPSSTNLDLSATPFMATSVVTITSDSDDYTVEPETVSVDIYEAGHTMTPATNTVAGTDFTAGQIVPGALTFGAALENKHLTVELLDADGDVQDSVDTRVIDDGGLKAALRFTKSGSYSDCRILYKEATGAKYQPYTFSLAADFEVSAAGKTALKLYKNKTEDYDACAGTGTDTAETDEIELAFADSTSAEATIDVFASNADSAAPNFGFEDYFVQLEDQYGNAIQTDTILVDTDTAALNPAELAGTYTLSSTDADPLVLTYKEVGTDVITFDPGTLGVAPIQVDVTVSAAQAAKQLAKVEVLPASEYLLKNGEIPVLVKAFDQNGSLFDFSATGLIVKISHPNLVKLYDKDRSAGGNVIENGDVIKSNDGEYVLSMQPYNTEQKVTLSVRNTSGTVEGSADVYIVEKLSDFTTPVAAVTGASVISIDPEATGEWVVTVSDAAGNPLSGKTVTFSSDKASVVEATSSAVTDSEGKATATLTAKGEGLANVTATSEGKSTSVAVTIGEAGLTLSETDVTIEGAGTASVSVSGGTAPYTIESSDTTVASVPADLTEAGDFDITGVAAGSAAVTVTDADSNTAEVSVKVNAVTPVPTEPDTKTPDEDATDEEKAAFIGASPIDMGGVATGGDNTMDLSIAFPAYDSAVDLYAAVTLPDMTLFFVNADGELVTDFVPTFENVTASQKVIVFEGFETCGPFGGATVPEGTYGAYWLILPAGTDVNAVDWATDAYELGFYFFDVSCD